MSAKLYNHVFCVLRFLVFISLSLCSTINLHARIIFQDDFENGLAGWALGSNVSIAEFGGADGMKCAKVVYNCSGTGPYWFSHSVSTENVSELWIRFNFKRDCLSGSGLGGCKFLKLFGKQDTPEGYANTTFAINGFSASLYEISYGNGEGILNDTQMTIGYRGTKTDPEVIIEYSSASFMPQNNRWHNFEIHMKYNDTGQRNGIYEVWIDSNPWLRAVNIKNRHDSNSNEFRSVDLANYSNSNPVPYLEWHLYYDNIIISTERISGIIYPLHPPDTAPPAVPARLSVIGD